MAVKSKVSASAMESAMSRNDIGVAIAKYLLLIVIINGCLWGIMLKRRQYPDQKEVFMKSADSKGYTLYETSAYELRDSQEWMFNFGIQALMSALANGVADEKDRSQIEAQIEHIKKWESRVLGWHDEFSKIVSNRDRIYRYNYVDEDDDDWGFMIINSGKVVMKVNHRDGYIIGTDEEWQFPER